MKTSKSIIVLMVAVLLPATSTAQAPSPAKRRAVDLVDRLAPDLIALSDRVWALAETALKETQSAGLLSDYLERQGFRVERGVAGMPTAFVATYGSGAPVIGVLGEYDALPGLSQKASPQKGPLAPGAPGHGCGHNLLGAASLGAATAVKRLIEAGELQGTVRFYGTPAEEAVGGKVYMVRDGLFRDLDVCLAWHPADRTEADMFGGQALVDLAVEFRGKTAHAAFDPWNGRSAGDAAEAFTHGVNLLREHVRPSVRMHYVVQKAGDVPNVVPEDARVWCWVRDWEMAGVETVLERVRAIAQGAALIAGVEHTLTIQGGISEILINTAGARLLDANLRWLGPIQYTAEEEEFARSLQRSAGVRPVGLDGSIHPLEGQEPEGGSTDVGDVSYSVPTLHFSVTTAPRGVPWHSWYVVAAGGMSIGHKGMIQAAKALAASMADLYEKPQVLEEVKADFREKIKGLTYRSYIPAGPPRLP
ncbi:MAG: amidohydrolase [Acidobacteria bacterium]|nr:amidohydrolase [Acidobacteriota bacterium]